MSLCLHPLRGAGMEFPPPFRSSFGVVDSLGELTLLSHGSLCACPPRRFWVRLWKLVLAWVLLAYPGPAVAARVSSSLSTTHHVHHFHNKHGTVPIAINRMPFLTRGGHGTLLFFTHFCYKPAFLLRFSLINDSPICCMLLLLSVYIISLL